MRTNYYLKDLFSHSCIPIQPQTHLLLPIYISTYHYLGNIFIIHYTMTWVFSCHNLLFHCPSDPVSKHPSFHWALAPALEYFMIIHWTLDPDPVGDIPISSEIKFKINLPSTPRLLSFPVVVAIVMASVGCPSVQQWKRHKNGGLS